MNPPKENPPPPVPARAPQGGKAAALEAMAAPEVWTERMLTALATGLKGNRWFRLIDKVYRLETLVAAWEKVQSNAGGSGVDGITVQRFQKTCLDGLLGLKEQLQEAIYQPKPVKRVWHAAGVGYQPPAGEHLSRSAGPPHGRERLRDGPLRR